VGGDFAVVVIGPTMVIFGVSVDHDEGQSGQTTYSRREVADAHPRVD
jgi:hypothetical protein